MNPDPAGMFPSVLPTGKCEMWLTPCCGLGQACGRAHHFGGPVRLTHGCDRLIRVGLLVGFRG